MSFEFFLRFVGMIILAFGGLQLGLRLAQLANDPPEIWGLIIALVGALFGLILTNSGSYWSPLPMLTGMTLYSSPHSSSMIVIFLPLPVGQK